MNKSRMPPRKEPKEQVIYAASKRKAPPFKPQRPSQVPRIPTTESESSRAGAARKPSSPPKKKSATARIVEDSDGEDDGDEQSNSGLEDDPLAARATKPSKILKPPAKRTTARDVSPMHVSSDDAEPSRPQSATADRPPAPTPAERPVIPRPLLIRLLHEQFADSKTKIDEHAIHVLEKYFDIFVRETVERARLQKADDAAKAGGGDGVDADWMELEDLEKVAAGMMLDF